MAVDSPGDTWGRTMLVHCPGSDHTQAPGACRTGTREPPCRQRPRASELSSTLSRLFHACGKHMGKEGQGKLQTEGDFSTRPPFHPPPPPTEHRKCLRR